MFEKRLAVEVDGGQHGEEAIARRDEERTRWSKTRLSKTRLRRAEGLRGDSGTPSPYPSPVKGEGEWRHERIAHAIPPLGASGFDIRRK